MTDIIEGRKTYKLRIIVLGSACVGKSSLINQYVNNCFKKEYYPTKGLM